MRRNQGTAKEWCVRRNPLGRRSWAYTEALTSGYMMADEVHSSKFHASRGGVLVACPELDWFSDPGTAVGQNIFPISPPDKVLIFFGLADYAALFALGCSVASREPRICRL